MATARMVRIDKDSSVVHKLHTDVRRLEDVIFGHKKFEVRKDDRDYQVGDYLLLVEKWPYGVETGLECLVRVDYVCSLRPQFDAVGMSITMVGYERKEGP